jgi:hypothetical protein
MKQFYVYELVVVPDGAVCYVGKGTRRRMYVHQRNLKNSKYSQTGLYRRLRNLLESGKNFEPRKVFETDNEIEALAEEKRRIGMYGFGSLFNSTTHQGLTTADIDAAHRQALSKARREYVAKLKSETGQSSLPEVRAKISASNMGRQASEETRHTISQSISATYQGKFSETHKKALSVAAKTRKPRSKEGEENRLQALRSALCGKPKDTSKARNARKQRYYTVVSPNGTTYDAQSAGILTLLKTIELPFSNFYRAIKLGEYNGWKATLRSSSRLAFG